MNSVIRNAISGGNRMALENEVSINYMLKLSKIFEAYGDNIYEREARFLEEQLSFCMLDLRENDLIAGRLFEPPLLFAPQSNFAGVGYSFDENCVQSMKNDQSLSQEQIDNIDYLCDFWKDKTSRYATCQKYSEEQLALLTYEDCSIAPGIGFPLYRMGGAQMDPKRLLQKGLGGLIFEVDSKNSNDFYSSLKSVLVSLQKVCLRYADECKKLAQNCLSASREKELTQMYHNLQHIAYHKPDTFWQAIQLVNLFFVASGTFNYGRMDEYLGSYYTNDIDNCRITKEFALSLTKNLWSLIIERHSTWDSRIILGGQDRENLKDADQFALLAIETSRVMRDTIPQLTLRCYSGMNQEVYNKALDSIGEGTTYPLLYNDDVNIPAVAKAFDIDVTTAEKYVPFGCGEYVITNQSFGTPSGAINVLQGLNTTIYQQENSLLERSKNFDEFYNGYLDSLEKIIYLMAEQEKMEYEACSKDAAYLLYSLLYDDCIERGKPVFDGGIRYLGGTLECYGNTNTSDSLTAIKTLVFDKKVITATQLIDALENNFKGYEDIQHLLLQAPKFGNDDSIADSMAVRFHNDLCSRVKDCAKRVGLSSYLAVIINNSMNTTFGLQTGASADGRNANVYLANANNPTGGMDVNGVTAMLNSLVKMNVDIHAGSVQNMRFSKEMFGVFMDKTKALLETYFKNGGSQAMISVLGKHDLENAMKEPQKYGDLIVRVGGFSARFVELPETVQRELISRNLY